MSIIVAVVSYYSLAGKHIISSYHHIIIPSYHHIIISSYHHIIISSFHHIIISSYHHIIISSYHHIIISSYHHIIISSFQQIIKSWPHLSLLYIICCQYHQLPVSSGASIVISIILAVLVVLSSAGRHIIPSFTHDHQLSASSSSASSSPWSSYYPSAGKQIITAKWREEKKQIKLPLWSASSGVNIIISTIVAVVVTLFNGQ